MKDMLGTKVKNIYYVILYLIAFILSNFIVFYFGSKGLIFTALFLIPFDFVMRCLFQEQWKGKDLFLRLGGLVFVSSIITFFINRASLNIALGSSLGFICAQLVATIFYQKFINKSYFVKVNGSDAVGIVADSIVFQLIAFQTINPMVSLGQICLKLLGGLFWYWVIFKKIKLLK